MLRHLQRRLLHAEHELAEAAGVEDAGARRVVRVAGARVLRQVADLAGARDGAAARLPLPRERLGERGLAGAVAADEPDLVALVDPEGDVLHEHARADPDLEVVDGQHSGRTFLRVGGDKTAAEGQPDSLTA